MVYWLYWGLTPHQQSGSYRGGDDDVEMSVSLVEETGVPGGNHRPTASNWGGGGVGVGPPTSPCLGLG